MEEMIKYCSNCFQLSTFSLNSEKILSRNIYKCDQCGALSVCCVMPNCDSMALAPKEAIIYDFYCAEHNGSIRNFEMVNSSIDSLLDYKMLMVRRKSNAKLIATKMVSGVSAAVILGLTGGAAAPAVAAKLGTLGLLGSASTGTAISTLSGAALTSASLAAIGGSVAGGVAVISAAGAAFGAYKGGAIAQGYFGEVSSFNISTIKEGVKNKPTIITINGFMSNLESNRSKWIEMLKEFYPNNTIYEIEWESKRLINCFNLVSQVTSVSQFIKRYGKASVAGLKRSLQIIGLFDNPFYQAVLKAQMTGVLLADIIGRTNTKHKYILCGHSLGARVVFYSLLSLASGNNNRNSLNKIKDVHLFGGAVGTEPVIEWQNASRAVHGKIYNYYSDNDHVLGLAYKLSMFTSNPIGRNKIRKMSRIKNIDVSSHVSGHTKYIENARKYLHVKEVTLIGKIIRWFSKFFKKFR